MSKKKSATCIRKIYCCNCKREVNVRRTSGKKIYPHRPDLFRLRFYQCPDCTSYVGTHKGTWKPLGVIPSDEIKRARVYIHQLLDPLWKKPEGLISRGKLYARLSRELGYQYHTAEIRSIEEARRVYRTIRSIGRELISKK